MRKEDAILSFDFDNTLSRKDVQIYCKKLMDEGFNVQILTSRFNKNNKHGFKTDNNDLFEVAEEMGINKIIFTNQELKVNYLENNVIWHLDDDNIELFEIRERKRCKTIGIRVLYGDWKTNCNRVIKKTLF